MGSYTKEYPIGSSGLSSELTREKKAYYGLMDSVTSLNNRLFPTSSPMGSNTNISEIDSNLGRLQESLEGISKGLNEFTQELNEFSEGLQELKGRMYESKCAHKK